MTISEAEFIDICRTLTASERKVFLRIAGSIISGHLSLTIDEVLRLDAAELEELSRICFPLH